MKKASLDKRKKLNKIVGDIVSLYKDTEERLITLCYEKGIQQKEIANALGVSKQRINREYPKDKYGN